MAVVSDDDSFSISVDGKLELFAAVVSVSGDISVDDDGSSAEAHGEELLW